MSPTVQTDGLFVYRSEVAGLVALKERIIFAFGSDSESFKLREGGLCFSDTNHNVLQKDQEHIGRKLLRGMNPEHPPGMPSKILPSGFFHIFVGKGDDHHHP